MPEDITAVGRQEGIEEPVDQDDPLVQLHKQFKAWDERVARYWHDPYFKGLNDLREYARGKTEDDGSSGQVRTNLAHSTIKSLMPHIYAKNPEIAVGPSDGVDQSELAAVKLFTKTIQTVINQQLTRAGLKSVAKRCTRGALSSAVSWAKISFQREYGRDPIMAQRFEDAQDNIARIDKQIRALEDTGERSPEELLAKQAELRNVLASVALRTEVVIQRGLVLDRVFPEHLLIDPSIAELDDYVKARRITQIIYKPLSAAREWFDNDLKGAKHLNWSDAGPSYDDSYGSRVGKIVTQQNQADPMVKIFESWDKDTMSIYTRVDGLNKFALEPYQPVALGERWYPFFGLWFDDTEGYKWPLSLVELIKELVDEYNSSRTQQSEHRELSVPHWMAAKDTDRTTLERYKDAVIGDITLVDTQGRALREVIDVANPPPFNPSIYDTTAVRQDISELSGLQDAARGAVQKPKTATEADILQQGLTSRSAEMQDRIEDWVEEMANYSGEILLQELDLAEVQHIAGASAVWPELSKDEIFEKVKIQIRAGTSGKPDKRREQETWLQLLPLIRELQGIVSQKMQAGLDPSPEIALAKETLRRFDESIEIDEFFPAAAQTPQGAPDQAQPQPGLDLLPPEIGGNNVVQFPGGGTPNPAAASG